MQNAGIDPRVDSVAERCEQTEARRRAAEAARAREEVAFEEAAEARGRPMWAADDAASWDDEDDDEREQ